MNVGFEEAVATLSAMFDGNLDEMVIKTVLISCNGHLENTVEALLSMTSMPESTSPDGPEEVVPETAPPPVTTTTTAVATFEADSSPPKNTLELPDDFLRVPGGWTGGPASGGGGFDDQGVAQAIYDELFLAEIAQDPEFAQYLAAEQAYLSDVASGRSGRYAPRTGTVRSMLTTGRPVQHRRPEPSGVAEPGEPSGPSLKEKISAMTDTAKHKLARMWMKFRSKKAKTDDGSYQELPLMDGDAEVISFEDDEEEDTPAPHSGISHRNRAQSEDT